jgi:hypothetical protein
MQRSLKYIAYQKMLARRRQLWLLLLIGMPALMFALVFMSGDAGAFITFPVLLLLFLAWKYFWAQNDICPWCRKAFSEGWSGGTGSRSRSGKLRCANCEKPA